MVDERRGQSTSKGANLAQRIGSRNVVLFLVKCVYCLLEYQSIYLFISLFMLLVSVRMRTLAMNTLVDGASAVTLVIAGASRSRSQAAMVLPSFTVMTLRCPG